VQNEGTAVDPILINKKQGLFFSGTGRINTSHGRKYSTGNGSYDEL
jgi:hypothetical protein